MARLIKEQALHKRDEKGDLIPIEVKLELLEKEGQETPTILAIPMSRAAFNQIVKESMAQNLETSKDQNGEIVKKYCAEPKFTDKEIAAMTLEYANAIATAVMSITTGKTQKEIESAGRIALKQYGEKQERELKKK